MSYDLMVFDAAVPPSGHDGFMSWYHEQAEGIEQHGYDNPDVTAPELRGWFFDMIEQFPAMNGPHASQDDDDPKVSDYSIGRSVIYVAFAWSQAELAYHTSFRLAEKHGVGFFNLSSEEEQVWMPNKRGQYTCINGNSSISGDDSINDDNNNPTKRWWQFWK